jgi:hypothetical protein
MQFMVKAPTRSRVGGLSDDLKLAAVIGSYSGFEVLG